MPEQYDNNYSRSRTGSLHSQSRSAQRSNQRNRQQTDRHSSSNRSSSDRTQQNKNYERSTDRYRTDRGGYTSHKAGYRNQSSSAKTRSRDRSNSTQGSSRIQPASIDNTRPRNQNSSDEKSRYQNQGNYLQRKKPKKSLKPLLIFLAVVVVVGAGAFYLWETRTFKVSVNGTTVELKGEHSVASLVKEGYADPQPGDLHAIDGTLLEQGKGELYAAVVNGSAISDFDQKLRGGEVIIISDGSDTVEPIEEKTEIVPFESIEEGVGPIHVLEGSGVDGERVIKTGTLSGLTQTEDTVAPVNEVYRKYYPNVQGEKVVALTFDDGPWHETTAQVLDVLDEHQVKATFFTVGERVTGEGVDLVKRASNAGHQICTHSFSHARGEGKSVDMSLMSADAQVSDIEKGLEVIKEATGKEASKVFRAPGGNFKPSTRKAVGSHVSAEIGWTIDSRDWKQPGVEAIVAEIEAAGPGGVVLLHDGGGDRKQTVEALKIAIPHLKEKGYRFVTIDELIAYGPA